MCVCECVRVCVCVYFLIASTVEYLQINMQFDKLLIKVDFDQWSLSRGPTCAIQAVLVGFLFYISFNLLCNLFIT